MSSRDPRNANYEGVEEGGPVGSGKGKKGGRKGKKGKQHHARLTQVEPKKRSGVVMFVEKGGEEEEELLLECVPGGRRQVYRLEQRNATGKPYPYEQQTEVFPFPKTPYSRLQTDLNDTLKHLYDTILKDISRTDSRSTSLVCTLGRVFFRNAKHVQAPYLMSSRLLHHHGVNKAVNNSDIDTLYEPNLYDADSLPDLVSAGFVKTDNKTVTHQLKDVTIPNLTGGYELTFTQQNNSSDIIFTSAVKHSPPLTVDGVSLGTGLNDVRFRIVPTSTHTDDVNVKEFVSKLVLSVEGGIVVPLKSAFSIGCYRVKSRDREDDPHVGVYEKGPLRVTISKLESYDHTQSPASKQNPYYCEVMFVGIEDVIGRHVESSRDTLREVSRTLAPGLCDLLQVISWGTVTLTEEQLWEQVAVPRLDNKDKVNKIKANFALAFPETGDDEDEEVVRRKKPEAEVAAPKTEVPEAAPEAVAPEAVPEAAPVQGDEQQPATDTNA